MTAVVDADAQASALHPHRWSQLFGEIGSDLVKVEWVVVPTAAERDLFLGEIAGAGREARTSLSFPGRPTIRTLELSYFPAASRRNHAKIVSGRTIWQHASRS